VVSRAITYARHQLGKAYCWGGTGPSCYDCSGLAMRAEQSARVSIPRTSELQFADGHRVSHPERGDLVFFAGADGSATSPGHVGLVLGPHRMIEAYATGWPIRVSSFGLPTSPEGDTNPVGFTRPGVR
jgi:cell wall-associated NlpC family hydrolase